MSARGRAAVVLAAVFIAGALAGWGLRGQRPARRAAGVAEFDSRIWDVLEISDAQRQAIDSILDASEPSTRALTESIRISLRAHLDSVDERMRSVLNEEQRRRLDSLRAATAEPLAPALRRRQPLGR